MAARRAFTLIELLVVVAIIAALLAIMLPSAGMAMYKARSSHCASNKRQILVGMLGYATDHMTHLPHWNNDGNFYWMQDHPGIIFTVPRDQYGVPLELWSCAVASTPQLPALWGGYGPVYKWKMSGSAWWVMRGGNPGSNEDVANPARNIVSSKLGLIDPAAVIISDSISGNAAPTSSFHTYGGQIIEGSVVRFDSSSTLVPVREMKIRNPNEGWGNWWY